MNSKKASGPKRGAKSSARSKVVRKASNPDRVDLVRTRELTREVESLRRREKISERRADRLVLLNSVISRVARILDPERLMQETARIVQERMDYTYVAVVVLDSDGVLVGRWAGREGVRHRAGKAQGPAGGVIGRAIRTHAPQVVADVKKDPDYYRDVEQTRSELAVPLIDEGEVVGALDFQSERVSAFDLEDVAAAEALADFVVVALRNARLVDDLRRRAIADG